MSCANVDERIKKRSSVSLMDQAAAVSSSQRPLRHSSLCKNNAFYLQIKASPNNLFSMCVCMYCFRRNREEGVKSCMQNKPKAIQATQRAKQNESIIIIATIIENGACDTVMMPLRRLVA